MDSPNFPIILCHINLWLPRGSDGREPAQLALVVKSPPANAGNIRDVGFISGWGRSPGGGHATHSSILAWRFPMDRGAWQVWSMGSQSQTQLKRLSTCILISSSILQFILFLYSWITFFSFLIHQHLLFFSRFISSLILFPDYSSSQHSHFCPVSYALASYCSLYQL